MTDTIATDTGSVVGMLADMDAAGWIGPAARAQLGAAESADRRENREREQAIDRRHAAIASEHERAGLIAKATGQAEPEVPSVGDVLQRMSDADDRSSRARELREAVARGDVELLDAPPAESTRAHRRKLAEQLGVTDYDRTRAHRGRVAARAGMVPHPEDIDVLLGPARRR